MRKIRERGITLIALVITIVVLLILAGITIGAITGDNGIINKTGQAKEDAEIANEKEIIDTSTVEAMGKNKRGNLEEDEFQSAIDKHTDGKVEVTDIGEEFEVYFTETNRYYMVDKDGNIGETQEVVKDKSPGDITKDENGNDLKGDENEPFEIWCIEDLVALSIMSNGGDETLGLPSRSFKGEYVILATTLNFNSILSYNDYTTNIYGDINKDGIIENIKTELTKKEENCEGFQPIDNFQGNLDGRYNEIQNIYINRDEKAALITIGNSITESIESIKNIGVTGEITSKSNVAAGIVTGYTSGSNGVKCIENCWNKATIKTLSGVSVAGICTGASLVIKNCYNEGDVINEANSSGQAGGIVAGNGGDNIVNCYNTGNITATGTGHNNTWYVGGIASGHGNRKTTIKNSYNTGKITGGVLATGGIIATNCEMIENCYNIGEVSQGVKNNGGIIGSLAGNIKNCYNAGKINGKVSVVSDEIKELSESDIKNNQTFVETLNKNIGTNSDWKKWKLGEDGYPTFE